MRLKLLGLFLFVVVPTTVFAQTTEVFGGYSFAHQGDVNIGKGWNAAVTGNFVPWFGITGDVSGHYYSQDIVVFAGTQSLTATADANILQFRAGPSFRMKNEGPVSVFGHVLVGGAHSKFSGRASVGGQNLSVSQTSTGFAAATGGGVDIGKGSIAIRAIQVDYNVFRATLEGVTDTSNGVRVSAGIIFRFGS